MSVRPNYQAIPKPVKKIHVRDGTRDDSFPVTENSELSVEKFDNMLEESESGIDEVVLSDDTFEESCDHHITYLQELAAVAQVSYDKYKDDREDFKDCLDCYRKYMIEKSALTDTLNDIKSEMVTLNKKITTSKKSKRSAGKRMKISKSVMTGYFMKVSEHKTKNKKTLLKTQKKLTKRKSNRKLTISEK